MWPPYRRPPKCDPVRKDDQKPPRVSVEALALSLPKHAWRTIMWREGTNKKLQSRFARVRVRAAPIRGEARFDEETLLIEWPEGEAKPIKYWLATVDRKMSFRGLVDLAKLRWRIERDYEDLKQEIGLGHYEGRGWRGFHHHGTLAIAAYGFLTSERERIPPSGPHSAAPIEKSPLPRVIDPAAPPIRPQRHVPNSIATIHRLLAAAVAANLPRCPCCARRTPASRRWKL
jgi:SRSO17 transposase